MFQRIVRLALWVIGVSALGLVTLLVISDLGSAQPAPPPPQVERWLEPLPDTDWGEAAFRRLATQLPDFAQARWESVSLPDTRPMPARADAAEGLPMARVWFRVRYRIPADAAPDDAIALFIPRVMGGAWSIYANEQLLASNARDWRMQWNRVVHVRLPRSMAAAERVEFKIAIPFRLAQGYAIGSIRVGPEDRIQPMYVLRELCQSTLPAAVLLMILLMGAGSFQFWLVRRSELQYLYMALAAIAWTVFDLQYFYDIQTHPVAAQWLAAVVDASISWVFLLIYLFATRVENRHQPVMEAVLGALAVLDVLATLPVWHWQVNGLLLQHWLHIAYCACVATQLAWFAVASRQREMVVLCLALWTMIAVGTHDLAYATGQVDPDVLHLSPYGMFAVFLAFQYANQRRYIRALQNVERSNEVLHEQLALREQELARNYRRLAEAEQHQTLLMERHRLMQDMHDGIGSALMSSLAMVESGRLPAANVGSMLRECIDELRLVIHSLEPLEHDLTTLLASLRQRLGKRLEAAGIALHWKMGDLPPVSWLEAPQALQILRIMQELLTNVLKHAQASEIEIESRLVHGDKDGAACILVSVADNGLGFDPATVERGRGLNNMMERAKRLGCRLEFQPGSRAGVRAVLTLPAGHAAPVAVLTGGRLP